MGFLKTTLSVLSVSLLIGCTTQDQPAPEPSKVKSPEFIRVTGIPDENPTELQRKNAVLVEYLSQELGTPVKYVPVTDYGAAVQALSAGQIDFAWLGGFTHVQARTMSEAIPLTMRAIDRDFKSAFIAHHESGVEKVEDLKGKTIAFGSKSSTSGHLMPRHFLLSQFQIDPSKDLASEPVFSNCTHRRQTAGINATPQQRNNNKTCPGVLWVVNPRELGTGP